MNATTLALGLIMSCIGLGFFMVGKKRRHAVHMLTGFGLMTAPYVIYEPLWLAGVGVALGIIIGTVIGAVAGNVGIGVAMGITFGAAVGAAFGMMLEASRPRSDETDNTNE